MFKKLNVTLSELDTDRLKNNSIFSKPTFKEFSINDRDYLFSILDNQFQFNISPHAVNITEISYPGIKPHTDSWPVAINIYFDVGSDETCFWKNVSLKESSPVDSRPGAAGLIKSYNAGDLQKVGSFIANKGDCYLLDIKKIHSIEMSVPNTTRKILRLCWQKYSFDEILESIKLKNNF
jgi:hypothetical protein